MTDYDEVPGFRIGEVAARTGMTIAALRAWERRYGLLVPARTAGGQRLYSEADVARVGAVQRLVAEGWSLPGAVARLRADTEAPNEQSEAVDEEHAGRVALLGSMADVDSEAVLVAYQTARMMMRARTPAELRDALIALVERLGGTVGPAAEQDDQVLPVDLAMGEGPPVLPRAATLSLARMRLEAILPGLVEDARELAHHQRLAARRVTQEV
ncbi:MAG: MerR family transcriptional regulator [Actinomycetota bacterium]|nr:MerR family transcriptional regulator [Actinomycetota bacterium]